MTIRRPTHRWEDVTLVFLVLLVLFVIASFF